MTTQTADNLIIPQNSTNVRSHVAAPGWLRASFSIAGFVAPSLTAAVAESLFFRTRRNGPRPGEREVLESASTSSVAGMRTWSWGEGPTVLLVHGWNGRGSQLGGFVEPLISRGYRVVTFDAYGHGESPGNSMSIPELANCIQEVADGVGGLYGVIAHSMGGAATTVALSNGLKLQRAVFVSPPSDPKMFLKVFSDALGIPDEVRAYLKERVERRVGITMENMRADRIASSMRVPLLVIHDRNDKEVPVDSGQRIAHAWPSADLIITEGLGHQRILRSDHVTSVAVSFIDAIQRRKIAA